MHWWTGAILGVVQGVTEFLPISSSGHLVLAERLFGIREDNLSFDILVHAGTLAAVTAAFAKDVWRLVTRPFSKLSLLVATAAVPTGLIGILFKGAFERLFDSGATLGWEFLASGTILALAAQVRSEGRDETTATVGDALVVGVLQGAAIMPALSRSGLTIAGALWRGLDRTFAARFSFLASIPPILGATLLAWKDAPAGGGLIASPADLAGFITAAVSGFICVRYMVRKVARGQLRFFVVYLWILGIAVLLDQWFLHRFFS